MASIGLPRLRARLHIEQLESRQLLSGYTPTVTEQVFLEQLNEARADPAAYGRSIGLDLSNVSPAQPLAISTQLTQAARQHAQDMALRGYFAHVTPEGVNAGQRISNSGFFWSSYGESLAGGTTYPGPTEALRGLVIDAGVPNLGHRKHLLAIDAVFKAQNQVGIGIVQGSGTLGNYYTIDSAAGSDTRPFITGVVYRDANGNGRYDGGEGLGGVTVTAPGGGTTTTYATGGYSIQVSPGTYTVTASGAGLAAPVSRTVAVGSTNVRVNFVPGSTSTTPAPAPSPTVQAGDASYVQKLYQRLLGRSAGAGDIAYWSNILQVYGRGAVVVGIEQSAEARGRLVNTWYATYMGRSPAAAETQWWVNVLNLGATEEQVQAVLLSSPEAYNRAQALNPSTDGDASYIRTLFQQLLNRAATDSDVQVFARQIMPYVGRTGVATMILAAPEYKGGMVRNYYSTLLRRSASAAEVGYWVAVSPTMAVARIGIAMSNEYYNNG